MDFAINVPGCVSNVVDGLNAAEKRYLKGEMETLGKLSSNNASKIRMLHSASIYVFIEFVEQFFTS